MSPASMPVMSPSARSSAAAAAVHPADDLPSWNAGQAKAEVLDFVTRVTTEGGLDFVPAEDRIAVFDNDGTLWSEQPLYFQFLFAVDRIKAMAADHQEWQTTEPFRSLLTGDTKALAGQGTKAVEQLMATAHSGMTTEAFEEIVRDWLLAARHPHFDRPFHSLVFQPMLELMAYLRANDFKTFIVSGGGVEFIRVFAEKTYGVPPEQVVGSSVVTRFEHDPDGTTRLVKTPAVEFIDDGPGKPQGINRFIGRRPILAFGNSDGDLQMFQYVASGPGPRFVGLVHHTDAAREFAYDRQSHAGKLDAALDEALRRGWTVADMQTDWRAIYPPGR